MAFNIELIKDEINGCKTLKSLEEINIKYLGRENGLITNAMKNLGKIAGIQERKALGANLNDLKKSLIEQIGFKEQIIKELEIENKINSETIDVTAPANYIIHGQIGSVHPLTKTMDDLRKIVHDDGFAIYEGYDIETSYSNFSILNTNRLHPARQSQDTIYIDGNSISDSIKDDKHFEAPADDKEFLLRTHTSAQQIRIAKQIIDRLKEEGVPEDKYKFKYVTLGRTYRNESDKTHSPMFHQIEGVCISTWVFAQDLINTLMSILSKFFGIHSDKLQIKLRSSYFPFTVPSWEMDLFLPEKNQFVEILGCGMVHPSIIEAMGLDSSVYGGYAFGAGIERLSMLRSGVTDLRKFYGTEWIVE